MFKINTQRQIIIRKPKYETKEEADIINNINVKLASRIYQMKPKYKQYRRDLRRRKLLMKIHDYLYDNCPEDEIDDLNNKFNKITDTFEIKNEFIKEFDKDTYMKHIL